MRGDLVPTGYGSLWLIGIIDEEVHLSECVKHKT